VKPLLKSKFQRRIHQLFHLRKRRRKKTTIRQQSTRRPNPPTLLEESQKARLLPVHQGEAETVNAQTLMLLLSPRLQPHLNQRRRKAIKQGHSRSLALLRLAWEFLLPPPPPPRRIRNRRKVVKRMRARRGIVTATKSVTEKWWHVMERIARRSGFIWIVRG
jgi:hypothetical protein